MGVGWCGSLLGLWSGLVSSCLRLSPFMWGWVLVGLVSVFWYASRGVSLSATMAILSTSCPTMRLPSSCPTRTFGHGYSQPLSGHSLHSFFHAVPNLLRDPAGSSSRYLWKLYEQWASPLGSCVLQKRSVIFMACLPRGNQRLPQTPSTTRRRNPSSSWWPARAAKPRLRYDGDRCLCQCQQPGSAVRVQTDMN